MYDQSIQRRRHPRSLRNACRSAFTAVTLLLAAPAFAQNYPNGLSTDSVDPAADAAYIKVLRHHLDSVRRVEGRPTVALVLSGGGAKGAAQVGALKYLEEQKIPVDIVMGTSIGGLIGGLYAVGYTSGELRDLFCTQDWGKTLTDKVDPEHIPYTTKIQKQKYLINVPFHYETIRKKAKRVHDNESFSDGHQMDILPDFGATDETEYSTQKGVGNFTNSLPTGYAYGFNVNNLLTSLTVGYQDSISFASLPKPYLCVASDMVSLKAKYWTSGSLKTAMRSTMSIPGLFDPVRTQEMILVDGGTRNNYPTDVARAAGADYIIGIELADADPEYTDVKHLGNILGQFIKMLGKDAYDKNIDYPSVRVQPVLKGFNMLSFNAAAVDTMILRGYRAFEEKADELAAIKEAVGEAKEHEFRKAVDISRTPVLIRSITIDDVSDYESALLMKRIGLKAGQYVDKATMDEAMSKIQATGAFESVTYALHGTAEPYDLVFNCNRGPTHEGSIGVRIDTEEWAAIMLRLGLNTRKLMGSKADFSARLGRTQKVTARFSQDFPALPTVNAEMDFTHSAFDLFSNPDSRTTKETWEHSAVHGKVFLSNIKGKKFNFELGGQYKYFSINTKRSMGAVIESLAPDFNNTSYLGVYADARLFTLDDLYYPSRGVSFDLLFDSDLAHLGYSNFSPYLAGSFNFRGVIPIGERFAIIPDIHWRSCFSADGSEMQSYFHENFVGGSLSGRYFEQQINFVGCNGLTSMGPHVAVVNLDLRLRMTKNLYLSAQGGYVRSGVTFSELINSLQPTMYGFAGELGYDTIVGPLKFAVRWSDKIGWKLYATIGFDF